MTSWAMYLLFGSLAVLTLAALVREFADAYLRIRGTRIVTCPADNHKAAVAVKAFKGAIPAAIGLPPALQLLDCSRWPEQCGCEGRCLNQIAAAPRETLLRFILGARYHAQPCAFCADPFGDGARGTVRALMDADGSIVDVLDIPAERLDGLLASHEPVCSRCYGHLVIPRGQRVFFTGARPVDRL